MGLFKLCKSDQDHVLEALFKTYGANILRVPEQRVQPLTVFARSDGKHRFVGRLGPLLDGGRRPAMRVATSPMAEVSGKRTRTIDVGAGVDIMSGLLSGLGIPPAEVTAHFSSARKMSFSVGEVTRSWIDLGLLGRALERRRIDRRNSATRVYFGDRPWALFVVESAISSDSFTVKVERSRGASSKLDVAAIQQSLGKASARLEVASASSFEVSFRGPKALTFAFGCVRLFLDRNGRIVLISPEDTFLNAAVARGEIVHIPDRVRLSTSPTMVEWDRP
jgi:hypothetical protein